MNSLRRLMGLAIAGSVPCLVAHPSYGQLTKILRVTVTPIEDSVQLVLTTSNDASVQVFQSQTANTLIVDVVGAQLALPTAIPYRQRYETGPIADLAIEQLDDTTVRVTLTSSTDDLPEVFQARNSDQLTLDVLPSDAIAEGDVPPEADADSLQLIVVAKPPPRYEPLREGTRTGGDILKTPQSIQSVPQAVVEDQGGVGVGAALRNVSGVSTGRLGSGNRGSLPIIRGFESTSILRNGLRDDTLRFGSTINNIERVEVLKGPSSVLFGAGSLGGVVNLVTERPLSTPRYEAEFTFGSDDLRRVETDFTGPLDASGNLAYRLNLAYEEGGNFQDFAESEFLFIAPAFQLINTEDTELILDFEHSRTRSRGAGPGLPAIPAIGIENNTLPALEAALSGGASQFTLDSLESAGELDLRTNVGEPDLSESETIINRVGYQYSHRFSDDWRFESQFLASFQESTPDNVFAGTGYEQVAGQTDFESAVRLFLENPSRREGYTVNANVVGDFDILGLEQTLLFGAEWSYEVERDKITQTLQQNSTLVQDPQTGAISFEDYGRFNVFDPNYESRRFVNPDSLINLGGLALDSLTITETVGIYGQTQIDLVDGLSIVLGGRFDMADQFFADAVNTANPEINAYDTAFSPRLGLVFSPVDSLSVYATYAESFQPTIGRGVDGDVFIPERGKQFEAGIKASLLDDRLLATFAYYDLSRINVLTQDPDNPGFQVQVGEQSSEGFEFDLVGEILPGWNIIASYAYTDAKVTEDEVFEVGTRLVNAPDHAASLWTSYQVQAGALEGLGLGVGVYFVGDRNGDIRVPFEIPSYTRTDASIFYQGEGVRAQINFQNLFDVRYFEGARDQNRVIPGQPFTITGSLSWTF